MKIEFGFIIQFLLKFISKSLGVVQVQQAKLAVFNIEIKDDKFKLPAFPVKKVDDVLGGSEVPELSAEQEQMMEEMMKETGNIYSK